MFERPRELYGFGWTYSNILSITPLSLPELPGFLLTKPPLLHCHIHKRLLNALTHSQAAAAYEDPAIKSIDDEPNNIRLQPHFVLHVLGLAFDTSVFTALHNALDILFMVA